LADYAFFPLLEDAYEYRERSAARVALSQLALAEQDRCKADVLHRIADEAEQGTLCTVDRLHGDRPAVSAPLLTV
jgi:hypothetical protein